MKYLGRTDRAEDIKPKVYLTQAEFDALPVKDSRTEYIIDPA